MLPELSACHVGAVQITVPPTTCRSRRPSGQQSPKQLDAYGAPSAASAVILIAAFLPRGIIEHACYADFVTMNRRDYDLLAGMHAASTVALLCADTVSANAAVWTHARRRGLSQPRCFRSLRQPSVQVVGECPDRKQGPGKNFYKPLSFAVCAGRNVA